MPTLSTTYLIPAILLNPAFILHLINTFFSHLTPPSPPVISHSPHPFMESIGPVPGSTPYLDVLADDGLCWRYTAVMVVVQILAFGRVSNNRVRRRKAKAAKAERERERSRNERLEEDCLVHEQKRSPAVGTYAANDSVEEPDKMNDDSGANRNRNKDGVIQRLNGKGDYSNERTSVNSEESLTETSEEEMMI